MPLSLSNAVRELQVRDDDERPNLTGDLQTRIVLQSFLAAKPGPEARRTREGKLRQTGGQAAVGEALRFNPTSVDLQSTDFPTFLFETQTPGVGDSVHLRPVERLYHLHA